MRNNESGFRRNKTAQVQSFVDIHRLTQTSRIHDVKEKLSENNSEDLEDESKKNQKK